MEKYSVCIRQASDYWFYVVAESEQAAEELAQKRYSEDGPDSADYTDGDVFVEDVISGQTMCSNASHL